MIRYVLDGKFITSGSPKIVPRIGEKVSAGFLPGICVVIEIEHDLNHGFVNLHLTQLRSING